MSAAGELADSELGDHRVLGGIQELVYLFELIQGVQDLHDVADRDAIVAAFDCVDRADAYVSQAGELFLGKPPCLARDPAPLAQAGQGAQHPRGRHDFFVHGRIFAANQSNRNDLDASGVPSERSIERTQA